MDLNEKCPLWAHVLEYPACDRVCRGGAAFSEEVGHPGQAGNVCTPLFLQFILSVSCMWLETPSLRFLQWLPAPMLPSHYGLFLWNCKPEQTFLYKPPLVKVSYCNDRKVTDAPGKDAVLGGAEFVRNQNGKKDILL